MQCFHAACQPVHTSTLQMCDNNQNLLENPPLPTSLSLIVSVVRFLLNLFDSQCKNCHHIRVYLHVSSIFTLS